MYIIIVVLIQDEETCLYIYICYIDQVKVMTIIDFNKNDLTRQNVIGAGVPNSTSRHVYIYIYNIS